MKIIDISDLSSLCSTSRSEALKNIFLNIRRGERVKLITKDPELSFAIRNLEDSYSYKVIDFNKHGDRFEITVEKV